VLWTALKSDIAHRSEDEKERQHADDLLGLMTPVIKGVLTDKGFEHAVMAQQVFGGHGYIEEHGMSQFVRDARIAMIYEGANGIQALDLVGRKLAMNGGRAVQAFFKEVGEFCESQPRQRGDGALHQGAEEGPERSAGRHHVADAERHGQPGQCRRCLDRLHAPLRPRVAGLHVGADGQGCAGEAGRGRQRLGDSFYENKLVTGRYFMERVMPETAAHLARISTGADTMMALPAEAF
jgi:acyl-CoA dehydrogenase